MIGKSKVLGMRTLLFALASLAIACGGGGDDGGRDCNDDLRRIKADSCFPRIEQLAIQYGVTEQGFLDVCWNAPDQLYSDTKWCIENELAQGDCDWAFELYWRGADASCNPLLR